MQSAPSPPAAAPNANDLALSPRLMPEHHAMVEHACRAILAATYADLSNELVSAYRTFEHELIEHMEAEEDELLPAYAEASPDDAALIRGEHARLRYLLEMVAVDVELHALRAEKMHALLAELRAHAAREDERMYPWAARHLAAGPAQRITYRIRASIARLARIIKPVVER